MREEVKVKVKELTTQTIESTTQTQESITQVIELTTQVIELITQVQELTSQVIEFTSQVIERTTQVMRFFIKEQQINTLVFFALSQLNEVKPNNKLPLHPENKNKKRTKPTHLLAHLHFFRHTLQRLKIQKSNQANTRRT